MSPLEPIKTLSDVLSWYGRFKTAISSFKEANWRVPPATHGKAAEDFFAGTLPPGARKRISGVLSPYVLSTAQLAYRSIVAGRSPETITKVVHRPEQGVTEKTATVEITAK